MSTRIDTVDAAKMLRKVLKADYPETKFSVRSSRYAGGSSIDVSWTDGPTQPEIQAVCDRYKGASFDGMTDMKEYHDTIVVDENGPQVVHFGADFIFANRTISDEWAGMIGRKIARLAGKPCDLSSRYSGSDWNQRYPVCFGYYTLDSDGRVEKLSRCDTEEYASTLLHRYCHNRRRMPLAQLQKS